ncbi:hypothetical protein J3R83DRAFT_5444 [Lanmaoa asiatica]|nr:hypothetical protein J3R83DRAFT_5444 [Lanmaoa asiatica]
MSEMDVTSSHPLKPISHADMERSSLMSLVDVTMQEQPKTLRNSLATSVEHNVLDPHFIWHPYLTSLNLVINTEFHFLVCQLCKEAIATPTTRTHIINKHPELLPAFNLGHFQKTITKLHLMSSLPTDISGPRTIVHGLLICDALACQHCSTVMTGSKRMREHHIQYHQDQMVPNTWRSCKAQRMKAEGAGSQRTFWEIVVAPVAGSNAIIEQLMKDLNKQLENVQVPIDH